MGNISLRFTPVGGQIEITPAIREISRFPHLRAPIFVKASQGVLDPARLILNTFKHLAKATQRTI